MHSKHKQDCLTLSRGHQWKSKTPWAIMGNFELPSEKNQDSWKTNRAMNAWNDGIYCDRYSPLGDLYSSSVPGPWSHRSTTWACLVFHNLCAGIGRSQNMERTQHLKRGTNFSIATSNPNIQGGIIDAQTGPASCKKQASLILLIRMLMRNQVSVVIWRDISATSKFGCGVSCQAQRIHRSAWVPYLLIPTTSDSCIGWELCWELRTSQ